MAVYRVKDRRTRKASKNMVVDMAKYSNNHIKNQYGKRPFRTDADVKRYVEMYDLRFDEFVEKCRAANAQVGMFENLLTGADWTVSAMGPGSSMSFTNKVGEEILVSDSNEEVTFTEYSYYAAFEQSVKHFERCLESGRYEDFLSCIADGLASIEAYLRLMASGFNRRHPGHEIIDDASNKVRFDEKIDIWIPRMAGGRRLDKSTQHWADFKELKKLRDNAQTHIKDSFRVSRRSETLKVLNMFRTGVAGMLLDLHKVFNDTSAPAPIVKFAYLPDVETAYEGG